MRFRTFPTLLILLLGACRSGGASGESVVAPWPEALRTEVWVDVAAAGEGEGTRERPWGSLRDALARPGPLTVYLAAGEYLGSIEVSGDVRLEGQGAATVLGGAGVRVAGEGRVVLRNLSVRGGGWGVEVSGGGQVQVERVGFVGQREGAVRVTSGRFEAAQTRFETSGETVGVLLDGTVEDGAARAGTQEAPAPRDARQVRSKRAQGEAAARVGARDAPVPQDARQLPSMRVVAGDAALQGTALPTGYTGGETSGWSPKEERGRGPVKSSGPPRQEAWLSGVTFTGPFRRAVRIRGPEARATLKDIRFLGAVTAVGMDGGHAEIRHSVAEGHQGTAFSVVEGVMSLEDVRARGHEVSVSAMRVPRLEVRGLLSVGATRAGLSVGASTGVLLEDVVVRDSGSHGALHFSGSEVKARRLRVEGATEYGVVAVGGSLELRGITVASVRSNDGITGEGLHLRQVRAEVENAVVRETAGACVFAAQNARVVLRDAELSRCGQSALAVDTRARLDATGVEARGTQEAALAAMAGGELRVDALIARKTRRGLVSVECTGDTRVKLGRVHTDDDRGMAAPCVERLATEAVPGPR
ncbi:putative lipoprotein [Myxococcus stipitatus DSM 14675]|uniref:Putative lipoprotein n=1 Tax=Myxococcus stipitatus (strain DSM 14675 / JCM 12634 / Mx s8) TaxID=1278073 RepID=L7U3M9_MYXSD|nr:hypothetical protein [Myxococcus stipitatus]AGC42803.1 putative lipoprotein [Myxococcus stipitatus DSM 14675]